MLKNVVEDTGKQRNRHNQGAKLYLIQYQLSLAPARSRGGTCVFSHTHTLLSTVRRMYAPHVYDRQCYVVHETDDNKNKPCSVKRTALRTSPCIPSHLWRHGPTYSNDYGALTLH